MDSKMRYCIEQLTNEIRNAYNIQIPISDIDAVVHSMGGTVVEDEYCIGLCEGTVNRTEKGFSVRIEKQLSENKRARIFDIATELGHVFLHMGFRIDNDLWNSRELNKYYSFPLSDDYAQAQYFAACLLMPRYSYVDTLDVYTKDRDVDILKVADYFNVPAAYVMQYGYTLGYLEPR